MSRNGIQFAVKSGANYLQQRLAYRFDWPFNKPMQIAVSITDACAARCVMCDIWKLPVKDELTASEWIQSLDQIRRWMGPFWLSLSGGEPFQKPGIFDILKFCRDNQIKTKISSNGIMLRETYLDRVLRYPARHPRALCSLRGGIALPACARSAHRVGCGDRHHGRQLS